MYSVIFNISTIPLHFPPHSHGSLQIWYPPVSPYQIHHLSVSLLLPTCCCCCESSPVTAFLSSVAACCLSSACCLLCVHFTLASKSGREVCSMTVWTLYRRRVPGAGTRYLVPLVCILDSYLDLYPTFAYILTNVTIFSVRPIYVSQLKTLIYKIALQMTSNKTNETQIM